MKVWIFLFAAACSLMPISASATDGKKALMLTVFGTSTEATITFDELVPLVRDRFPDRDVVVPYTSGVIRNKLNAGVHNPAKRILSPEEMLEKLRADGYTDIAVVSTILFPGVEHDKLIDTVSRFSAANPGLQVSYTPPLLSEAANLEPVVATLGKHMLAGAANVVVAHGTHDGHPVEHTYMALADAVAATYPDARVGSVEGVPDIDEVMEWVEGRPDPEVRFIVFMFVAGDHAENDIASDEDDSMFSTVRAMGKTPSVPMLDTAIGKRIASLGLDPAYRALLLDHYTQGVAR